MIELFGEMPMDLINAGESSKEWFTEEGALQSFNPRVHLVAEPIAPFQDF